MVSVLTISVATGLTAAEYKGPNLSGQTVSIAGPWLTGDEENFDKVNAYFEKATGAKVDYAGSDSFEQQIVIDIKAGSPESCGFSSTGAGSKHGRHRRIGSAW